MKELILASSSRWRAELLSRLRVPFVVQAASIDESPLPGEVAVALAVRLAREKAEKIFASAPASLVIGSDQVCHVDGIILHKPGTVARAGEQLARLSGRTALFTTAVCVCAPGFSGADQQTDQVIYRELDQRDIDAYLQAEPDAAECAGACRAESLGIALCHEISSTDPTALIGLPLIKLTALLHQAGLDIPTHPTP